MTTTEAAADLQTPENGTSPDNGSDPSPEVCAGEPKTAPPTFTFMPEGPEFGPPTGVPSTRRVIDYGGPIVVPATSAIVVSGTERWFFRQLNKVQKRIEAGSASALELAFFWLEHAGVDEAVINRVALLDVKEWERFYTAWMSGAADSNLGE